MMKRILALVGWWSAAGMVFASTSSLLSVDVPALVAPADLHYAHPADRSESGLPLGNGRMGSLLWTTPAALRLEPNRVDVFGSYSGTNSFPERHTDYCGGCGFIDIALVDYGDDVFTAAGTSSHLSCQDGLATIAGRGVKIRALAWMKGDAMAFEVTDDRTAPETIRIHLRALRPLQNRAGSQTAISHLVARDGKIVLTQAFREDKFYSGSALAVGVTGRAAQVRAIRDDELTLAVAPGAGTFTIFVASAASLNAGDQLEETALQQLDLAATRGFPALLADNTAWWADFWSKSFIHLHSADGVADLIDQNYQYYLYLTAVTSRGKYPTKFNGMLWTTGGDTRNWGGEFWGANQSCLYNDALLAANHAELLDPMFDMYSAAYDSLAVAARQQWGSEGIWIPETMAFDGLAPLPDDIAAEMRELYLLKKPWEQMSAKFRAYALTKLPFNSRWNWIGPGEWINGHFEPTERGGGPYGPVTHTFARGAKIAFQYWQRYEYTLDRAWLRDRAYPMVKGVAEFYRHYPNLEKGADGRYHLNHVNSNESIWGGRDTDEELSAMMGLLPVAIRASEILGVDADLRPAWREILEHLAPLPRSDDPTGPEMRAAAARALANGGGRRPGAAAPIAGGPNSATAAERSGGLPEAGQGGPYWIRALPPIVRGFGGSRPDGNTMPQWFFNLCTLENDNPEARRIANATFDGYVQGPRANANVGVLSKLPLAAAMLGRAEDVRRLLPNQVSAPERSALLENRMDLREGRQTTSDQRIGNAADALHTALCQSIPRLPGEPTVIRVFPAWPTAWDAEFRLRCVGGFLVSSAMRGGQIEFVEIGAQLGGECRLRNPWGEAEVELYRNGHKAEQVHGSLLKFNTAEQEVIVVVRPGTTPDQYRRTVAAGPRPAAMGKVD
jgi:hypothetical protein